MQTILSLKGTPSSTQNFSTNHYLSDQINQVVQHTKLPNMTVKYPAGKVISHCNYSYMTSYFLSLITQILLDIMILQIF